jgi:hypothetical protein
MIKEIAGREFTQHLTKAPPGPTAFRMISPTLLIDPCTGTFHSILADKLLGTPLYQTAYSDTKRPLTPNAKTPNAIWRDGVR